MTAHRSFIDRRISKSHVQDWTRLCRTVAFRENPRGGRKKTKRFEEDEVAQRQSTDRH